MRRCCYAIDTLMLLRYAHYVTAAAIRRCQLRAGGAAMLIREMAMISVMLVVADFTTS